MFMNKEKTPIEVVVRVNKKGIQTPLAVIWDETEYPIKRIKSARPAHVFSEKDNIVKFICSFGRYDRTIYFDIENNQWFMLLTNDNY